MRDHLGSEGLGATCPGFADLLREVPELKGTGPLQGLQGHGELLLSPGARWLFPLFCPCRGDGRSLLFPRDS